MSTYLVEIPLKVRLYGYAGAAPDKDGSIKFVVNADDSEEACNKVAVLIAEAFADEVEGCDDAPVVLS